LTLFFLSSNAEKSGKSNQDSIQQVPLTSLKGDKIITKETAEQGNVS
jgi:hypothetical protein